MKKAIRKVRVVAAKPKTTAKVATTKKAVRTTKTQSKPKDGFRHGEDGFRVGAEKKQRQDEEYERRKETPFGFWLKPGDEAEVILLDSAPPFFVSLHKVKQNGRWEDAPCIEDTGQRCPLCESQGKAGSYTMVLTCLDRRPYKIKNGPNAGKTIQVSKKLLQVKGRNLPKFERLYKGNAKGNFRGIKVMCRRDGEKEAGIGEDLEFLGRVKESFLAKFGDEAKAAEYEKIYELPSPAEMRKRYALSKSEVAGSNEFEDGDSEELDDAGWDN